uniref:Putative LOC100574098 [Acyrthosiphon pisum] n=1 Tax=Lepeophtheirus salmonis TaxID=72036 RepID=A0A0K2U6N6_LEPSM
MKISILKPEAVPTIFPEAPSYLSVLPTPKRKTSLALSINRCVKERKSVEATKSAFIDSDIIARFEAIQEKIDRS